jgi:exoribonuclease-2
MAIVIEMVVTDDGTLQSSNLYSATVRNRAKLAYSSAGAWLEGNGPIPQEISAVKGLEENLRLQDKAAQNLKELRYLNGALNFETIKARPKFEGNELKDMISEKRNRAHELIENFMVAANGITARFLASKRFPSIRRVVRTPKRWERIVELALDKGYSLPDEPDSDALEQFLESEQASDPLRFPDLSLSVIKLMGPGEYVVELPGQSSEGHFGLAVKDYTHSTAPNRRYPDIITHRLLKAAKAGHPVPYDDEELDSLAKHCTNQENAAKKVERQVGKSATALLLEKRIGERFNAIVTGASEKGTWVRIMNPPVEGRLARGYEGLDVGASLRVQLLSTDVERGYIDFKGII